MKDHCDWMLNLIIFNQIQLQMGPCELDLFASCLTRQLTRFYSWRPDPEAEKTDAFNHDWSTTEGFANPPWFLIAKFLSQTKQQQARLIMIAPLWGHPTMAPNQSGNIGGLPVRQDLVILPTPQDKFIMIQGIPDIVTWPISGNHSHHEGFLQKLQTPSWRTKIKPTMILCLPNGLIGISKGIEISLLVL